MSPRCHLFCLFLLLMADPGRTGALGSNRDRPAPRSIAYVDQVYPFSIRQRARLLQQIAADHTVVVEPSCVAPNAGPVPTKTLTERATFPTGTCLIYVFMSLQC